MALLQAKVKIKGVRPLLFHCFTTETLSLEKKERTGIAGNDPEEWKRTFTATKDGQLYLEPSYIFGCLREGAKHTKNGRGSIQSSLAATLQVLDEKIYLDRRIPKKLEKITLDPSQSVYLDVRSVRNPNTKGRNIRYRLAVSPGWEAEFNIIWENTLINREQMKSVCRDSGTLVGLADGRSIGYGRFEILSFELEEYNAQKKTS